MASCRTEKGKPRSQSDPQGEATSVSRESQGPAPGPPPALVGGGGAGQPLLPLPPLSTWPGCSGTLQPQQGPAGPAPFLTPSVPSHFRNCYTNEQKDTGFFCRESCLFTSCLHHLS